MLFCLTGEYTPHALRALAEQPTTDRQAAVQSLVEAAGGKLVAMYGRLVNGPGVMTIFDVPDPDMAGAIVATAVAADAIQGPNLTRLFTMAEVSAIRQKRAKLASAYKAPGKG